MADLFQKVQKKAQKKVNKQFEDKFGYEPGQWAYGIPENYYVNQTSQSDEDTQKMISQLLKAVGTQTAVAQNRASDTLYDAPLASRTAAERGVESRGNQVVQQGTAQLELAQNESQRAARSRFFDLSVDEKKLNAELQAQKDASESALIGDLFSAIGTMIGYSIGGPVGGAAAGAITQGITPNVQDFNYTNQPISPLLNY